MKTKVIVMLTSLIFPCFQIFCQENRKAELSFGIGFPEAINIGFRYQIKQSQIGASFGFFPGNPDAFLFNYKHVISLCGDYSHHFGSKSNYSDLKPSYIRLGLNFWLLKWESDPETYLNIPLRIGRDFHFSPKGGLSLDGGFMFVVVDSGSGIRRILPSVGIRFFNRI